MPDIRELHEKLKALRCAIKLAHEEQDFGHRDALQWEVHVLDCQILAAQRADREARALYFR